MDKISIAEAAFIASAFDKAGAYKEANLLDQYIEAAGDLEKQAGIWDRVKGNLKKVFIKEYRELFDKAREAQDALEEKVKKINEEYKELRKDLKNYRLNEWQYKVNALPVETKDVMSDFSRSYANFLQYVVGIREQQEGGELKTDLSPSELLPKVGPTGESSPEKKPEGSEYAGSFARVGEDDILVRRDKFNEWSRLGHIRFRDGKAFLASSESGSKLPSNLLKAKERFGKVFFDVDSDSDKNFVILTPVGKESESTQSVQAPSAVQTESRMPAQPGHLEDLQPTSVIEEKYNTEEDTSNAPSPEVDTSVEKAPKEEVAPQAVVKEPSSEKATTKQPNDVSLPPEIAVLDDNKKYKAIVPSKTTKSGYRTIANLKGSTVKSKAGKWPPGTRFEEQQERKKKSRIDLIDRLMKTAERKERIEKINLLFNK